MKINQSERDGFTVISIAGELDINSSPRLREAFQPFCQQSAHNIIVDFAELSYVDSSGLATFIEILQRLKKQGGSLAFVQVPEKIRNLFEVTKLDKLFSIYHTQDEAIASSRVS